MDKKSFTKLQAELDQHDIMTTIKKNGPIYQTIVNFEVKKEYRTRISCKRFIIKLANSLSLSLSLLMLNILK